MTVLGRILASAVDLTKRFAREVKMILAQSVPVATEGVVRLSTQGVAVLAMVAALVALALPNPESNVYAEALFRLAQRLWNGAGQL